MSHDVIVAGAGIVGVSIALHLQKRGRKVLLVDRKAPGQETSYGNAGLIERSSLVPYAFPRDVADVLRYGLNGQPDAVYHLSALPHLAGWLFAYWRNSAPAPLAAAARAMRPLIERSVSEHDALIAEAGAEALFFRRGWLEVFTTPGKRDRLFADWEKLRGNGLTYDFLDGDGARALEPHLGGSVIAGIHFQDPVSTSDPGAVVNAYAALFQRLGGEVTTGDARSLTQESDGHWCIDTRQGRRSAPRVVVALGPWSDDVFRPLGYRFPLAVKRGYHMHYASAGNAVLTRSVVHAEGGYVLAPMAAGIRLTTGAEFALRDAPPSPVQLERTEPMARGLYPLGGRLEAEPWMGRRPILPDMRPVIGPAPRHKGLWFAFGHAHHGLTLGPVTGRLVADLVTGAEPVVDPAPYAATRF